MKLPKAATRGGVMRLLVFCSFLFPLLTLPESGTAQELPLRDARAVAVMQQSLLAMGGSVPADSAASGRITITAGSTTEAGTIRILTRGLDQTAELVDTEEGKRAVIYAHNRAVEVDDRGSVQKLWMELVVTSRSVLFPLVPVGAALGDPDTAFQYLGRESLDGSFVEHVRFWKTFASTPDLKDLAQFTITDLWLDAASGFPRKLAYERREASGDAIGVSVEVTYADHRNVGGILYPFQIKKSLNGTPWATITIGSVALNAGLTDSDFPVGKGAQ